MKQIIAILAMMAILTGCTSFGTIFQQKQTITLPPVHEGTQGLEISFLTNMPPAEVFENQLFEIGLDLNNKGAADVQNGIYTIAVNEQYITPVDEQIGRFNIKGKSVYDPLGGQERIRAKVQANALSGPIAKQSTTIITNVCYAYKTTGTIMTCIDTQPLKKETKTCTVKPVSTSAGQGGPVSAVYVEPRMPPHTNPEKIMPTYVIQIENRGTGQVIDANLVYDACTGRNIGKESYDLVKVRAMLSSDELACEPQQIKLKQKENKVVCTLKQGISANKGNYAAPLIIELEYGYMQTKAKTITLSKTKQQYY